MILRTDLQVFLGPVLGKSFYLLGSLSSKKRYSARMLIINAVVHLSASDLVGHLNCRYLTSLDLAVAKGERPKPFIWDPLLEVLAERGALHEQSYLKHLDAAGFSVVEIDGVGVDESAVATTVKAMRDGAPIIAQGAVRSGPVEAALFAFKSPLSKGAILADEVGLGKTIEAGTLG